MENNSIIYNIYELYVKCSCNEGEMQVLHLCTFKTPS